jgi:hypothetical protein
MGRHFVAIYDNCPRGKVVIDKRVVGKSIVDDHDIPVTKDEANFPIGGIVTKFRPATYRWDEDIRRKFIKELTYIPWPERNVQLTKAVRSLADTDRAFAAFLRTVNYQNLAPFSVALAFPNLRTLTGWWTSNDIEYYQFVKVVSEEICKDAQERGDEDAISIAKGYFGKNRALRSPARPEFCSNPDWDIPVDSVVRKLADIYRKRFWEYQKERHQYACQHPDDIRVTTRRGAAMGVSETVDRMPITRDTDSRTGNLFALAPPYDMVYRMDNSAIRKGYYERMDLPNSGYGKVEMLIKFMKEGRELNPTNLKAYFNAGLLRKGVTALRTTSQDEKVGDGDPFTQVCPTKDRFIEYEVPGFKNVYGEYDVAAFADYIMHSNYPFLKIGTLWNDRRFVAKESTNQMGLSMMVKAWLHDLEVSLTGFAGNREDFLASVEQWMAENPDGVIFAADFSNFEKVDGSSIALSRLLIPKEWASYILDYHNPTIIGSNLGPAVFCEILGSGDATTTWRAVLKVNFVKRVIYAVTISRLSGLDLVSVFDTLVAAWLEKNPCLTFADIKCRIGTSTDDITDLFKKPGFTQERWDEEFKRTLAQLSWSGIHLNYEIVVHHIAWGLLWDVRQHKAIPYQAAPLKHLFEDEEQVWLLYSIFKFVTRARASGYLSAIDRAIRRMNFPAVRDFKDLETLAHELEIVMTRSGYSMTDLFDPYSPSSLREAGFTLQKGGLTSDDPRFESVALSPDTKRAYLQLFNQISYDAD